MRKTVLVVALLAVSTAAAQPLTVGTMPSDPWTAVILDTPPVTFINLANVATAGGTLNRASVQWSGTCTNAFKFVFLRTAVSLGTPSAFTVVAVRGPFNAVAGRNDFTLSPSVSIQKYDLIGIVQLQPYSVCGSVMHQPTKFGAGYRAISNNDVSTLGALGGNTNFISGALLALMAWGSDPLLTRVLPAAGAVQGSGAFFRTSLQLENVPPAFASSAISGQLVFHKAGVPASAGDPTLPFKLNPGQVLSYPDVITTMGASGLGSLDVLTTGGTPLVTARVFSDNGAAGTLGFTEEGLPPGDALGFFQRGVLLIPPDLTNFRMNVGVRTLDGGATITISSYGTDGTFHGPFRTATYAANYFEQTTVNQFAGSAFVEPGGSIVVYVSSVTGAIFVYGTVTDNRTQDSSMRMAVAN